MKNSRWDKASKQTLIYKIRTEWTKDAIILLHVCLYL